jgi:hypothetical protein
MSRSSLATIAALALLAGCSKQPASETAAADPATTTASTGVAREEVTPEPAPTPAPAPAVIQTQPGPKGAQVALNRVAVTGDIMTVALTYSGGQCCVYTPVDKVSAIDDATSQRFGVLKDNAGNWMAAPINSDNKELRIETSTSAPVQVWFKFPAPPATSQTVSITIPEVAPFDAVPVQR